MANNEFMHRKSVEKLNYELRRLILSVRDLENCVAQESLDREQVKAAFAEIYHPTSFYSPSIQELPAINPASRTWLNKHGAALTPHSSDRIIMTLATTVYSDNEDSEATTAIVRAMISANRSRPVIKNDGAASRSQRNNQGQLSQVQSNDIISSKIEHNVAMRFRT